MQERREPISKVVREEVVPLNLLKDPQQCEVTMLREYKNTNRKRNPKTHIIGKKARKISKKKEKLEKLQNGYKRSY